MSRKIYNLYEAKTALSRLVDRAAAGEEIVIAKAGSPRAKLVPVRLPRRRRKPGGWEGRVRIAKNFDAPLPLPPHHADPFDRMLVAQATLEGLTLVTHDRALARYGLPVITA